MSITNDAESDDVTKNSTITTTATIAMTDDSGKSSRNTKMVQGRRGRAEQHNEREEHRGHVQVRVAQPQPPPVGVGPAVPECRRTAL
jgi:hypothetical protein